MRWWQTLVPFFIGEGALHEAVKEGQIVKIAGLLKQGFNIDYYYRNYTPLQLSLLHRQYHCTLFLLKYGANPNLRCYSSIEENQGPTIEPYLKVWVSPYNSQFTAIKQRNESIIRLLTLHGATNVVFPSSTAYYEVL